jgi:alanyl aminopeptidase
VAPAGFRLPDAARPLSYRVELALDPESAPFTGRVRIEVALVRPAARVWLNAKGLTVSEALVTAGGRTLRAEPSLVDDEFLVLDLPEPVPAGAATLDLRFSGRLDDTGLLGPYRRRSGGAWAVFTTFTAIEARRAFPCFDEPRFKTPWTLTLRIPAALRAFSNAPQVSEAPLAGGWKEVRFSPTAPLPSEVIAFAVGAFETTAETLAGRRGIPVRTVTPPGLAGQGRYAAEVTDLVLRRLEEYTDIPYPWEKLDHIALPQGAFGAVENPGLITYVSRGLLPPPDAATVEKRRAIRGLLTHELAHQWFGNLVTQAAWEDVWLSEGFATWLTARLMDQERDPGQKNLNAVEARARIMGLDGSPKSRPVRLALADRAAMRAVYSPFVYQKAGAILLMLEAWLGETRFRDGLREYLRRHRDANASTADFAAVLGEDTGRVLSSFLDRTGIPEIRAEARCGPGEPSLVLRQGGQKPWTVPVCWRTDGAAACTLLGTAEQAVPLAACPAWIEPNAGGTGYYRSAWPSGRVPPPGALSAAERLTLVHDLQGRAELRPLLETLARDAEPQVADAARKALAPAGQ